MATRIKPPWIKSAASRNVSRRARALGIMRRKGIKPLSKAQARAACAEAEQAIERIGREMQRITAVEQDQRLTANRNRFRFGTMMWMGTE